MKKILFCLLLACPFYSMSQNTKNKTIHLNDSLYKLLIGEVTYFADSMVINPTIGHILKNSGKFRSETTMLNKANGFYWIKFELTSREPMPEKWIITFRNQNYLEVYVDSTNGEGMLYTPAPKKAGMLVPTYQKDYKSTFGGRPGVQISLKPDKKYTAYVKLKAVENIKVYKKTDYTLLYSNYLIERNLTQGLFQGIMLVLAFYNFLIFVMNREKIYFYYTCYLFFTSLVGMQTLEFMIPQWLADYPVVQLLIIGLSNLAIFFYAMFGLAFNDTKYNSPKWYKLLYFTGRIIVVFAILYTLVLVGGYVFPNNAPLWHFIQDLVLLVDNVIVYPVALLLLTYTFNLFFVESRFKFYFIMGSMALCSTYAFILFDGLVGLDIIKLSGLPNLYLLEAAVVVEILCFSMGLGYRMKINEQEKREAQEEVLQKTKENESLLLEQNRVLDEKIQERTQELQATNKELKASQEEVLVHNEELRQTQEELQTQRDFLDIQNLKLDAQNQKIRSSIRAAEVIQQAILPHESKLDELLKEYFIIYQPKDVVSGDFYWLKSMNNKLVLVVGDCTGHGVPGAFMTLIGYNLLDKIVGLWKITDPSEILSNLHIEIKDVLKQKYTRNNDGMDAVVICLDYQNPEAIEVLFSGAKNNLLYLESGCNEIKELKGTRKAIGGLQNENIQFETQKINLSKGSIIYVGSDGLNDQNNIQRKKFGRERIYSTLSQNASSPMQQQKIALEEALDRHMQGTEQRDDILWLGIRL